MGPCCEHFSWKHVADFDHVAGFDLDLGRCTACGTYLMYVWYYDNRSSYQPLTDEQAEHFLALQGTPKLRAALRKWIDP